jgi:hypothetical protein
MAQLFPIPPVFPITNFMINLTDAAGAIVNPDGAILIIADQARNLLTCTEGTGVNQNLARYNIFVGRPPNIGVPPPLKNLEDLFARFQGMGNFPPIVGGNWTGIPPGAAITVTAANLSSDIVTLGFTNCSDFLNNYLIPCTIGGANRTITFKKLIQPYLDNFVVAGAPAGARLLPINSSITNGNPAIQPDGDPFNDSLRVLYPGNSRGFIKGGIYRSRAAVSEYIPAPAGTVGFPRPALQPIPANENTLDCALREFYEETGTLLSNLNNLAPLNAALAPIVNPGWIDVNPAGHNIGLPITPRGTIVRFTRLESNLIYCLGNVSYTSIDVSGNQVIHNRTVYFIKATDELKANIIRTYRYQNNSEIFNLDFRNPAEAIVNMNPFSKCAYRLLSDIFPSLNGEGNIPQNNSCPAGPTIADPPPGGRYVPPGLRGGNSEDHFKQKYFKYKQKYMQLKNLI